MDLQHSENICRINKNYCFVRDMQYRIYADSAKKNGITVYAFFVLDCMLQKTEPFTQADISAETYISKQTICAIVKGLIADGYLRCVSGNGGRAGKQVELTDAGRKYAQDIVYPVRNAEKNAMSEISPALWDIIIETSQKYVELLNNA